MSDRVETIKAQVRLTRGAILKARGVWGAIKTIPAIVAVVEVVASAMSGVTGAEKREAVVDLIAGAIKLPFFLSPIKKMLIGWLVDMAIHWGNELIGHGWIKTYREKHLTFAQFAGVRMP